MHFSSNKWRSLLFTLSFVSAPCLTVAAQEVIVLPSTPSSLVKMTTQESKERIRQLLRSDLTQGGADELTFIALNRTGDVLDQLAEFVKEDYLPGRLPRGNVHVVLDALAYACKPESTERLVALHSFLGSETTKYYLKRSLDYSRSRGRTALLLFNPGLRQSDVYRDSLILWLKRNLSSEDVMDNIAAYIGSLTAEESRSELLHIVRDLLTDELEGDALNDLMAKLSVRLERQHQTPRRD